MYVEFKVEVGLAVVVLMHVWAVVVSVYVVGMVTVLV